MHVFVKGHELVEVAVGLACQIALEPGYDRIANIAAVTFGPRQLRQRQIPAVVVSNAHRIIQRIGVGPQHQPVKLLQDKVFLEPSNMTDLPQNRIDDGQFGTHQPCVIEIGNKRECAGTRVIDHLDQGARRKASCHQWPFGALRLGATMPRLTIMLATPVSPTTRAGNQVTADRWRGILEGLGHRVITPEQAKDETVDLLIAIHAWRSAEVITQMRQQHPRLPILVCLSGTDIYAFQASHPEVTHASMAAATALIGLHDLVGRAIPEAFRAKLRIIHQSAPVLVRKPNHPDAFDVCVIGHLRAEKDPFQTALASQQLQPESTIRITHVGQARDASWAARATAEMAAAPRYRWIGEVSRSETGELLATSRLMVLSSVMEGGANVLGEAIRAGVPVIASAIDGSIGLLGSDYAGYFPVGDTRALAQVLSRAEQDPSFLELLASQCAARAPLFDPERERAAWQQLLDDVMTVAPNG